MVSRNRARSDDGRESPETMISKTVRQKVTQGNAKNPKKGSKKWKESVLEKWRGALVKARLALYKKREKKKERYVRSTLARLRKIADAARKKPQGEEEKAPNKKSSSEKNGRLPLATRAVRKAQVLEEVETEGASTKIPRKAKATSGRSQADDGEHSLNGERIKSITKVKRGRKSSRSSAATDLDEGQAAKLKAEMERKEEVKNKWKTTLEIARFALQQKRERKKEQAQKVAIRRLRKSQCEGTFFPDNNIVQVGLSLKRPSLEELRNFAKKSRS